MYADALGLGGAEGQGRMDRHSYLASGLHYGRSP